MEDGNIEVKYGMPYKGSKNAIAEKIINALPEAENFYDLFGGGGAISHCAVLSGKYKHVYYNEFEPLIYKGFKMAINGEFKNEKRWISREDFFKLKDTDPYAAMCFSFGNNLRTYAYSPENEKLKKEVHEMLVAESVQDRRLKWIKLVHMICSMGKVRERQLTGLQRLQSLERLERLQSLQSLESLECTNLSYEQVKIKPNSVVYCDIPYKGTNKYKTEFDHDKFYEWALNHPFEIYISEYDMPKEFMVCCEWEKHVTLSPDSRVKAKERLFCNKSGAEVKQWTQGSLL